MGKVYAIYICYGIKLSVTKDTLKRDLSILKLINSKKYQECKVFYEKYGKVDSLLYGGDVSKSIENDYYLYSDSENNKDLYLGLLIKRHCVGGEISEKIDLPSEKEIIKFKGFCEANNIDHSSLGLYIIDDISY